MWKSETQEEESPRSGEPLLRRPGSPGQTEDVLKQLRDVPTQRGNKVFVGTQDLHAAFVLEVPDPESFVIGAAHYESSSWVKQHSTHPVVMSHLREDTRVQHTPSS